MQTKQMYQEQDPSDAMDITHCDFMSVYISAIHWYAIPGKSPALQQLPGVEEIITPAYGEFVDILGEQRELIKERIEDIAVRKQIFEELVYSDVLDLLKAGEKEKAREKVTQCMSYWLE